MRIYTVLATKGTKFLARKLFKDYYLASEYVEELANKFDKQYATLDDCEMSWYDYQADEEIDIHLYSDEV